MAFSSTSPKIHEDSHRPRTSCKPPSPGVKKRSTGYQRWSTKTQENMCLCFFMCYQNMIIILLAKHDLNDINKEMRGATWMSLMSWINVDVMVLGILFEVSWRIHMVNSFTACFFQLPMLPSHQLKKKREANCLLLTQLTSVHQTGLKPPLVNDRSA